MPPAVKLFGGRGIERLIAAPIALTANSVRESAVSHMNNANSHNIRTDAAKSTQQAFTYNPHLQ